MESRTSLIFIFTFCTSFHEGWGLPLMLRTDLCDLPVTHRVRTKRCSCNNQLDSECHYFCHLDIIWVNTPSKTTVYGLGSSIARGRRSTGRCLCANPADPTCSTFCHYSSENRAIMLVNPFKPVREKQDRPKNDGPGVLVLESDVMTFLRNLVRVRRRTTRKTTNIRQWATKARKPAYR